MKKSDTQQIVQLSDMPNGGSDIALKQNIQTLENVLNKVLALRPVTWRWKAEQSDKSTQYGFIAQEVEQVMPDLITEETWENGERVKFLSTKGMMPYAISAIKEQQEKIQALTNIAKKQQQELDSLRRLIKDLQKSLHELTAK